MMFRKLLQRNVYVKPVGDGWGVFRFSVLESFWDDLWSYGPGVALGNLLTEWVSLKLK